MVYQGHLVYNRHNERINKQGYKGGKKWRDRSDWVIHENSHEPCIDDHTATKISMRLEKNRRLHTRPGPKHYLLTDILYCGDCGTRMVGNSGFYACMNKVRNNSGCANGNIKADFLDREILKYLKKNLITKEFYEHFVSTIQAEYEKYKKESLSEQEQFLERIAEIDGQIERVMSLFARGKIKPEVIEKSIEPLQIEKEELEVKSKDLADMNEIINIKIEDFSNDAIRTQLARFDEIISEDNVTELRNLVRDFIYKIELHPKENPKTKKWLRPVHIQAYVRALTMIKVASPRGFEPLSQA